MVNKKIGRNLKIALSLIVCILLLSGCTSGWNISSSTKSEVQLEEESMLQSDDNNSNYTSSENAHTKGKPIEFSINDKLPINSEQGTYYLKVDSAETIIGDDGDLMYVLTYVYTSETCDTLEIAMGSNYKGNDYIIVKDESGFILTAEIRGVNNNQMPEEVRPGESRRVRIGFKIENSNSTYLDVTTKNSQNSENPGYIRVPIQQNNANKEMDSSSEGSKSEDSSTTQKPQSKPEKKTNMGTIDNFIDWIKIGLISDEYDKYIISSDSKTIA